jgi:hypothetical protein
MKRTILTPDGMDDDDDYYFILLQILPPNIRQ